ncbi:MAG: arsenate reductase family protein [Spirochaetaceae bacterium]
MTPQLIGTRKSSETRKAERFLKERGIPFQFVDLEERPLSPRELDEIAERSGGHDELMDQDSKEFEKRKMKYMAYDAREELLENPLLLKQPILRTDNGVAVKPDQQRLKELFS